MSIDYSDGKREEKSVLSVLQKAPDKSSTNLVGVESWSNWSLRYHLTPERSNILRPFDFSGLTVLELGAGMGAVSRYLAESCRELVIVEGTENRFNAACERLSDLDNWNGRVCNIQDFETEQRFDVVVVCGVLEYSELYVKGVDGSNPFETFLKKAQSLLKPGGGVVVAIENRIGLKYWSGAAEDHTGRLFDGIQGYGVKPTPRTFSKKELDGLLNSSGFSQVDRFYPFPDYKLASSVLSEDIFESAPEQVADLATARDFESYGQVPISLFNDFLAFEGLQSAGLGAEFSNSFLFFAWLEEESSEIRQKLMKGYLDGEKAWHFSSLRECPAKTTFKQVQSEIIADKLLLKTPSEKSFTKGGFKWRATSGPLVPGEALRSRLVRAAAYRNSESFFSELESFLSWSLGFWKLDNGSLKPIAFDATFANVKVTPSGDFQCFDLEWILESQPLSPSLFILRNVFVLNREKKVLGRIFEGSCLREIYENLCVRLNLVPAYKKDLDIEAAFQAMVLGQNQEDCRQSLFQQLNETLYDFSASEKSEEWLPMLRKAIKKSGGTSSFYTSGGYMPFRYRMVDELYGRLKLIPGLQAVAREVVRRGWKN